MERFYVNLFFFNKNFPAHLVVERTIQGTPVHPTTINSLPSLFPLNPQIPVVFSWLEFAKVNPRYDTILLQASKTETFLSLLCYRAVGTPRRPTILLQ